MARERLRSCPEAHTYLLALISPATRQLGLVLMDIDIRKTASPAACHPERHNSYNHASLLPHELTRSFIRTAMMS